MLFYSVFRKSAYVMIEGLPYTPPTTTHLPPPPHNGLMGWWVLGWPLKLVALGG